MSQFRICLSEGTNNPCFDFRFLFSLVFKEISLEKYMQNHPVVLCHSDFLKVAARVSMSSCVQGCNSTPQGTYNKAYTELNIT